MQNKKRSITRAATNNIRPLKNLQDARALEPDDLRNQVQKTLSTLSEADRQTLRQRLIAGLTQAGVNVGSSLFMLGIPAANLNDLTPTDMGKLLRYIRINFPSAIESLSGLLAESLVVKEGPALTARKIDEAA